jgi:hypothetical protein
MAKSLSRFQGIFADLLVGRDKSDIMPQELASFCLPHQPKCQKGCEDLSLGLALAAELGMAGVVKSTIGEPDELRRTLIPQDAHFMQDSGSLLNCPTELYKLKRDLAKHANRPTVFPLLYHALCRPSLEMLEPKRIFFRSQEVSWKSEVTMTSNKAVKYLLEEGHDPNEEFFADEAGLSTTTWIEWLKAIGPRGRLFLSNDNSHPGDSCGGDNLAHQLAANTLLLIDAGAEVDLHRTEMYVLLDKSLTGYMVNARQQSSRASVEMARSDDLWLQVYGRILTLQNTAEN